MRTVCVIWALVIITGVIAVVYVNNVIDDLVTQAITEEE